jgi:hypothetical protein
VGAGHVELIGERKDEYRILAGKPNRRKTLGNSSRRWEDNIKKDLRELEWIDMARDISRW